MLQVTGGTPAVTLHSFAQAAGRVNITPVTDLIVAKALGADPGPAFASYAPSNGMTIETGLPAAKSYVTTQINNITGGSIVDPLAGAFAVGDADDKVLDALGNAMGAASVDIGALRTQLLSNNPLTATVPAYLAKPVALSATAASSTAINLSWTAVAGATGYKVYRATSAGVATSGAPTATSTTTTYSDSGLSASTAYYYQVVPTNTVVTAGTASDEASATTSAAGGGGGGLTCDTTKFAQGAPVVAPTVQALAAYARTYTGSEGDLDNSFVFVASGSATLVFNADGTATYNGASYVPSSYCLETLSGGAGTQLVIHSGAMSHFDLKTTGVWNGYTAAGKVVNDTPYSGGGAASGTQMGGARIGTALDLTGKVTTLGNKQSSYGTTDGVDALYNNPWGVTTDGVNLYIADNGNYRIRKMMISTRVVSTLVGSTRGLTDGASNVALFDSPKGITTDGTYLYVTEPDASPAKIRQITIATGEVTTLNTGGNSSLLNLRPSITTDGNQLFVILNRQIYKVDKTGGAPVLLAGSATSGSADGTGASASFYAPAGLATDGTYVYLTDSGNHNIRKISIASGEVTTVAGLAGTPGTTNATGTNARFDNPNGITTDGIYLYVNDDNYNTIRKVKIDTTVVSAVAGGRGGLAGGYEDGTATAAGFKSVPSLTTDGVDLYLIDNGNQRLRVIE